MNGWLLYNSKDASVNEWFIQKLTRECRPLKLELVPKFTLSNKDKCHGAHRIKTVIQQEPEFFDGLLFKKVCFIKDTYHFLPLDTTDYLYFFLELAFCVTPVKFGFYTKLVKHPLVKPSWSEL